MAKAPKRAFVCNECGADYPRWQGQCSACHAWNTITEVRLAASPMVARNERLSGYAGSAGVAKVQKLSDISLEELPRFSTGFKEFDRVLGGGVVPGSAILIGGNPGAGKSTLLLQTLCKLAQQMKTLYVTGEESLQQVAMRAHRLGLPTDNLNMLSETSIEQICLIAEEEQPKLMVIDSIQVMHMADVQSSPGSVAQVRETAAYLTRFAKTRGVAIVMVGHVTKDGSLAGPKVLEHCIDCSVLLDGDADSRFRTLRSHKNRFGAVNELGVFAMTEQGLREVSNPSAIFLSRGDEVTSGSSVMVVWEGTRPLLVEIQALVDHSMMANPRRVAVGLEQNRLAILLAVLHRHGGLQMADQDVFVNVVGGVKVTETSADLALLLAMVSSLRDRPLPQDLVVFGEVGLAGEIRPVPSGQERISEAAKHGFRRAIVPAANVPDRLRWLLQTFKYQKNIRIHAFNEEGMEPYPHGWDVWSNGIKKFMAEKGIQPDLIYTSEEADAPQYMEHLGIETVLVDPKRTFMSISGAQIRENPFRYWEYIPTEVKPFFVRTVAILGGESSGKSTLVNKLANIFNTTSAWEYGRDYVFSHLGGDEIALQYSDYDKIALGHAQYIDFAVKYANKVAFIDTDFVTTQAFCKKYEGREHPFVQALIDEYRFDLVILLENNTPWVADGLRSLGSSVDRKEFQNLLVEMLEENNIEFVRVEEEDYDSRFLRCVELVREMMGEQR